MRFSTKVLRPVIWLLVFGCFGLYGFLGPGHSAQIYGAAFDLHMALEAMAAFLSMGAGVATAAVVGFPNIEAIREKRIKRWTAACKAIVGAIIAPVVSGIALLFFRMVRPWDFFQEEEALLAMAGIVWYTAVFAAVWLLICLLLVLSREPRPVRS